MEDTETGRQSIYREAALTQPEIDAVERCFNADNQDSEVKQVCRFECVPCGDIDPEGLNAAHWAECVEGTAG